MEPRFNEPLFNEVLDITNDILCPGQSYSKMYGIEPRYNEPQYNEFFNITDIIRKQAFSQDFESGSPNFMLAEGPHSMAPAAPCS